MYQPYPGSGQPPPVPETAAAPVSVSRAVRVMYAGAAASLISVIVDLTAIGPLRTQIAGHDTRNGARLTPDQVNTLVHVEIGALVVAGLVTVGIWIWLARKSAAGRNWARITASVLFGLDTVSTLAGVAGGALSAGGAARFYSLVVWVIGLAAIVLLWQRDSSAYFRGRPRY